jgi:hypothetical protein
MATADRRQILAAAIVGWFAPTGMMEAAEVNAAAVDPDAEATVYAHALPAYLYGFPFLHSATLRWNWLNRPPTGPLPSVPVNEMWRQNHWPSTALSFAGRACLETLTCAAWLDLGQEPVILSVPDSGSNYYAIRLCGVDSDVFAYVGSRAGASARHYAIVGPDWSGPLPASAVALLRAPTREAVLIGQVFVAGPRDFARARALQTHIDVTPLSLWAKLDATYPPNRETWMPHPALEPLAEWKTMRRALSENPTGGVSRAIVAWLDSLGFDAGDAGAVDAAVRRGLRRAATDGRAAIERARATPGGVAINGWLYPARTIGRAGLVGDFLTRASTQCASETLVDTIEEVTVLTTSIDASGVPLDGQLSYLVRFAPGNFPLAAAWSLTLCERNGTTEATGKGHLAGATPFESHDGLTVAIGTAARVNGAKLLAAPDGPFELVLRLYAPGPEVVAQRWQPPAPSAA